MDNNKCNANLTQLSVARKINCFEIWRQLTRVILLLSPLRGRKKCGTRSVGFIESPKRCAAGTDDGGDPSIPNGFTYVKVFKIRLQMGVIAFLLRYHKSFIVLLFCQMTRTNSLFGGVFDFQTKITRNRYNNNKPSSFSFRILPKTKTFLWSDVFRLCRGKLFSKTFRYRKRRRCGRKRFTVVVDAANTCKKNQINTRVQYFLTRFPA